MHKLFIGTILATSLLSLNACNNKEPENDPTISTPVKETTAPVVNNTAIPFDTSKKEPVITTTTAQPVSAGLNPAHGQPGHRCDIAVGAPLNSPATKPAATSTTQTITPAVTPTATPAATAANTVTAPGMNPAHGQPGHRCDISVGAPLNSPATKPAVTTTQTVTPAATAKPVTENNKPKEVINAIPALGDPVKKD